MALSFDAAIASFEPPLPLAVALSGGADSTALLLACTRRWPGRVAAIHINHGLQAAASSFEQHCAALCEQLRVRLHVSRVQARHASGQSPEAAARVARYEALHAAARSLDLRCVALGHHADDQVESVLLALSRGAGLAGLAGMRPRWERDGIAYCRPLLPVSGPEIRSWLSRQGIGWIEDPTNADEQFTRNRIRARLLPVLGEAFPQYRDTFARSARHAAQAQALLEEVAAQDLALAGVPPAIEVLRALSRARLANVLRHWLKSVHGQQASAAQLDELLGQIAACATRGHDIQVKAGTGFVRRQGKHLAFAG